ncbi:MAG: two-component regulator propeller domain-containing protein [Bacteroidota bacterium]
MRYRSLAFLLFLITACQGQSQTQPSEETTPSTTIDFFANPLEQSMPPVDTLFMEGAPNHITRNIIQDRNGNLWFATFGGVIRYDGMSFENMTEGVTDHRFFSVMEDRKGVFWLGTIGGGVFKYDGHSFEQWTVGDGLSDKITCIYEDSAGHIWLAGSGGMSRYDGQMLHHYTLTKDTMLAEKRPLRAARKEEILRATFEVNSIVEDRSGRFWFGTRGNTYNYDGTTFEKVKPNNQPFRNIRHILEDNDGNIWFGGNSGLWRYDGENYINITRTFVGYIYEDRKGNIWTSSDGWSLSYYEALDLKKDIFQPTIVKADEGMFFGILEADDGKIWAGTLNGVMTYDREQVTRYVDIR